MDIQVFLQTQVIQKNQLFQVNNVDRNKTYCQLAIEIEFLESLSFVMDCHQILFPILGEF